MDPFKMRKPEKSSENKTSTKDTTEKEYINISDLIDKVEKILKDKYSLSIISELIVNKKLTAKELENKETIQMKKSLLYSKLKLLENYNMIKSEYGIKESESQGGRGYAQKIYSFSADNFEKLAGNLIKYQERPELVRDVRLSYQYLLQAFLNREVNLLLNTTNEDYQRNFRSKFKEKNYNYGGIRFVKEEEFNLFQEKMNQVHKEMIEYNQGKINKDSDKDENNDGIHPYMIYFGFLYFPELDKDE